MLFFSAGIDIPALTHIYLTQSPAAFVFYVPLLPEHSEQKVCLGRLPRQSVGAVNKK